MVNSILLNSILDLVILTFHYWFFQWKITIVLFHLSIQTLNPWFYLEHLKTTLYHHSELLGSISLSITLWSKWSIIMMIWILLYNLFHQSDCYCLRLIWWSVFLDDCLFWSTLSSKHKCQWIQSEVEPNQSSYYFCFPTIW